ncbi:MAG TPA: hypothetical protein VG900_15795 [Hyphomicrobiaceae bacterium]|jgi:hypothetical protein|nr:hypothetical protein [Hyphomicrobiaceae bacterium]
MMMVVVIAGFAPMVLFLRHRRSRSSRQAGEESNRNEGGNSCFHSDTPWIVIALNVGIVPVAFNHDKSRSRNRARNVRRKIGLARGRRIYARAAALRK